MLSLSSRGMVWVMLRCWAWTLFSSPWMRCATSAMRLRATCSSVWRSLGATSWLMPTTVSTSIKTMNRTRNSV